MAGKPGYTRGELPTWHKHKIALSNETNTVIKKIRAHLNGTKLMTSIDIKVAQLVLSKTMPDLKAMEVSGDPDRPITLRTIITGVRRAGDLPHPVIDVTNGNQSHTELLPRLTSKDH